MEKLTDVYTTVVVDENNKDFDDYVGAIITLKNGILHSLNDEPAIVYPTLESHRAWFKDGKLHRDNDQPAEITWNGTKTWAINGVSHREGDLPAVEYLDGSKIWYKHGVRHRDGCAPSRRMRASG